MQLSMEEIEELDFFGKGEEKKVVKGESRSKTTTVGQKPYWVVDAENSQKEQAAALSQKDIEEIIQPLVVKPNHTMTELLSDLSWVEKLSAKDKKAFDILWKMLATYSVNLDHLNNEALRAQIESYDIYSLQNVIDLNLSTLLEEQECKEMILAALERLNTGEYGVCQYCRKKISDGRMNAKPYAVYCINCREKLEKAEKLRNG